MLKRAVTGVHMAPLWVLAPLVLLVVVCMVVALRVRKKPAAVGNEDEERGVCPDTFQYPFGVLREGTVKPKRV
jgi:hypothetical protein